MNEIYERSALLLGKEAIEKFKESRVAVFGIGGVGGYAAESLARSGIGTIDLFDNDIVSKSNINRQIVATTKTIGKYKVDIMKERINEINSDIIVNAYKVFYMPDVSHLYDFSDYDYIVDAIDTVTGKIEIIVQAKKNHVPVISSMGAGNKLNPEMFEIADIYKTSVCPLARVMRRELKNRGIKDVKVVYSKEKAIEVESTDNTRAVPGSVSFVPSVAGLIISGEVLKDLMKDPIK